MDSHKVKPQAKHEIDVEMQRAIDQDDELDERKERSKKRHFIAYDFLLNHRRKLPEEIKTFVLECQSQNKPLTRSQYLCLEYLKDCIVGNYKFPSNKTTLNGVASILLDVNQ